jgi:putative FmdB family regulatory protein
MPLYDYFCKECLKKYEVIIRLEDLEEQKDKVQCPHCAGLLEKILSAPYFVVRESIL